MNLVEYANKKFKRLFKNSSVTINDIISSKYFDSFIELDDDIGIDSIIDFINSHRESLIDSYKSNIHVIDALLEKDGKIYISEKEKLTDKYFVDLFDQICNGIYDNKTLIIILDVIHIISLYGINNNSIDDYLKTGVYSMACRGIIRGNVVDNDEQKKLSNVYFNWVSRFGNTLLEYINDFDILEKRLLELKESDLDVVLPYKKSISELYELCKKAIEYKNSDKIPSQEEKELINKMFENYRIINNEMIIKIVQDGDYSLVHFVQSKKVNYQLVGNKVIDIGVGQNNESDERQNKFFVDSYLKYCFDYIKEMTNKEFDYSDDNHRYLLSLMLELYNQVRNNEPTKRLPIEICETYDLKKYIRNSSSRISTTLLGSDKSISHKNRSIGIILVPIDFSGIISSSIGYTSQKEFIDFFNDGASVLEMLEYGIKGRPNEVTLDLTKCKVVGVICLTSESEDLSRASELASAYGVKVIRIDVKKTIK